ncbi:MAG: S41 family peptidase [Pyrinomonadaceae bacterium]
MNYTALAQVRDLSEPLTPQTKREIVASLVELLKQKYIFPDIASKLGAALRANLKDGKYQKVKDHGAFANALTADLRALAHDKHLGVKHRLGREPRRERLPPRPVIEGDKNKNPPNAEMLPPVRRPPWEIPPTVKTLDDNIGYLKLNGFGDGDEFQKAIDKAFDEMAKTDALIIDLRENGGGSPRGSQYLASYFFDESVQLSSIIRRNGNDFPEEKFSTLANIKGKKYLKKPVYILVSGQTFSAGENFAYDLQALKRAVITGEITGGGANPGEEFPLVKGMFAFIPTGRSYNYITKSNWEGKGVQPDIPTNEALEKAVAEIKKNRRSSTK